MEVKGRRISAILDMEDEIPSTERLALAASDFPLFLRKPLFCRALSPLVSGFLQYSYFG